MTKRRGRQPKLYVWTLLVREAPDRNWWVYAACRHPGDVEMETDLMDPALKTKIVRVEVPIPGVKHPVRVRERVEIVRRRR